VGISPSMTHLTDLDTSESSNRHLESTRSRAELFGLLLTKAGENRVSPSAFLLQLQKAGATIDEAKDYVDQLQEQL
jgi:hypothetical protein